MRERHREDREPVNTLVTFPLDGSDKPQVIAKGHDFYSTPRVSPDGARLAILAGADVNDPTPGRLMVAEAAGGGATIPGCWASAALVMQHKATAHEAPRVK